VLFDSVGKERLRITNAQEWEYNPRAVELRAVDLTGDGRDDLTLMTGQSIQAFDNAGKRLWETAATGWMPIVDVVEGNSSPTLVIGKDQTYLGVEGATGHVLWRCEGIRPDSQFPDQTQNWCLTARQGNRVPRIISRRDHALSRVSLPTDAAGRYSIMKQAVGLDLVGRAHDPRLLRRLPWDYKRGPAGELITACGFSLVLVVLPGAFAYRMLRHRRWSLRTWLLVPLVTALMISATYLFASLPMMRRSNNPYLQVAIVALSGTMVLPFPWLIVLWAYKRHWGRLSLLVSSSLVFAFAGGLIGYLIAARHLDPLEQFEWTWRGCWNIWLPVAMLCGWSGLLIASVAWLVRRSRARSVGTRLSDHRL
jgi:hypothetical protein